LAEPLVVVIPHKLGQDEATRRIKAGIARARTEFAKLLTIENEIWDGNRLVFSARAMGQHAMGIIDVGEASVRLEVTLPWLLAKFAAAAQRVIGQKGTLMLENKK
jgi:Putative polyhydroxyalkanoic acid system protein (PHA_gran_rgn)